MEAFSQLVCDRRRPRGEAGGGDGREVLVRTVPEAAGQGGENSGGEHPAGKDPRQPDSTCPATGDPGTLVVEVPMDSSKSRAYSPAWKSGRSPGGFSATR